MLGLFSASSFIQYALSLKKKKKKMELERRGVMN